MVAGDGIDETVALRLLLPQSAPLPRVGVEAYQSVIAAYANSVVRSFKQRVDMGGHTIREHLLQLSVTLYEYQSLFPRAQPQPSVTGLQHAQGIVGDGGTESRLLELVVQTVQTADGMGAPVADSPYLIGIVHIHLRYEAFGLGGVVVVRLLIIKGVMPDALFGSRYPQVAVFVYRQVGHCGVDVHGQAFKALGVVLQQEGSFVCSGIDAVFSGQQCGNILVAVILGNAIGVYFDTVVAAETIVGAEPQVAIFVLHDITYGIRRQSVFHADMSVWEIIGSPSIDEDAKCKYQCKQDSFHLFSLRTKLRLFPVLCKQKTA